MRMIGGTVALCFVLNIICKVSGFNDVFVNVLNDFLFISKRSVTLNVICCSELDEMRDLYHRLSSVQIRIIKSTQTEEIQQLGLDFDNPRRQDDVFVLDMACNNISNVLLMASNSNLFGFPYRWLLLNDQMDTVRTYSLQNYAILPDSDLIIIEPLHGSEEKMNLFQVYKIKMETSLLVEPFGEWSPSMGLTDMRVTDIISHRRRNLNRAAMTTSLALSEEGAITLLNKYSDPWNNTATRITYILTCYLLDALNATKLFIPDTYGYRNKSNPKQFTGMVGKLMTGEAEIGTPIFMVKERISLMEFITTTTPTRCAFIFRPPPLSYVSNIFTLPFTTSTWISSIVLVMIMAIGLLSATKWEWFSQVHSIKQNDENVDGDQNDNGENRLRASWSDILLISLGAVCQQGAPKEAKSISGRIIMLFLFTAVMFLYTSYSANIVSLLQSSSDNIRTLTDMLNAKMKFGIDDVVFFRHFAPLYDDPVGKIIYSQKIAPPGKKPNFFAVEEASEKVRTEFFAFYVELSKLYYFVGRTYQEHEKCGLVIVNYLPFIDPWVPIPKRSPYKEIFKVNYIKMRETGVQTREVWRHYTKRPKCESGNMNFVSVGLIDCYAAIMVVGGGIGFSIFFLLLEIILKMYNF